VRCCDTDAPPERDRQEETEDLHVGRWISQQIRELGQVGFESGDGSVNIDGMVQLRLRIDTPIRIGLKFWVMSPKIFPLPTMLRMLSRVLIEVTKQAELLDRARHAAGNDEVTDLERLHDD
jgi:hypothetical protein